MPRLPEGAPDPVARRHSTPALYVTAHALRRFMPAVHEARALRTISEVSLGYDEFQQLIEKSRQERKYLR